MTPTEALAAEALAERMTTQWRSGLMAVEFAAA